MIVGVASKRARRAVVACSLMVAWVSAAMLALGHLFGAEAAERKSAQMAIDANTGAVLHSEAGDEPRYPASLTKMMTIYLAFEAVEQGRTSLAKKIKISQEAANAAPSKLELDPGEEIALGDAIKALITKSANDVAIAVAEHISGSEKKFAELMTQKARQLGMTATTFRNASGLPDPAQTTTARDMLTLALRLQDDFPQHYPLFALRTASINGSSYKNHNTLLGQVEGVDGIKTGYTRMSGFNLVTSVRRGEKHVVAAVFGGVTAGLRNVQMRMLLNRALSRASTVKSRRPAPQLVASRRAGPRTDARAATPAVAPTVAPVVATAPIVVPAPYPVIRQAPRVVVSAPPVHAVSQPDQQQAAPPVVAPITVAVVQPQSPLPPIQIARVRPVMVASRLRSAVEVPAAPAPVIEQRPTTPARQITPAAPMVAPATASVQPAVGSFRPAAALVTPPAPVAAQPRSVARAHNDAFVPQRGNAPSTLQTQADALGRTAQPQPLAFTRTGQATGALPPQPAYNLRGPATASATPTPAIGGFQIQIGAYNSVAEADRAVADIRARASDIVGSASAVTTTATKQSRPIYRARFAGFDARTAAGACLELRRRQIDCFVMRAE